ncbi:MAG: ABC transporter permease [Deltaproteobacteria bacterium]|nr:ABC transporter permease [Deltaproteobacteria bacterium]MBW2305717.1 ABC transporter permease [Deltaproteobacteria bacterium]
MKPDRKRKSVLANPWILVAPAIVILAIFFLIPYLNLIMISFREVATDRPYGQAFTLANYKKGLTDTYYLNVLWTTLRFGFITTLVTLLIGYPVAYHLARTRSRWKSLLYAFVLSPLLVGVVIRCYGWIVLLSDKGLINDLLIKVGIVAHPLKLMYNSFGVGVGLVHVWLPFMILPLLGTIGSIDPSLEAAARSLGAGPLKTFFKITLPLSMPGVLSGSILVFILTISAYVIPILLGGFKLMIMPTLVVQQVLEAFLWPFGAALALILFVCAMVIIYSYNRTMVHVFRGVMGRI